MQTNGTVVLDGKQYTVTRAKLKRWLELEFFKSQALDLSKRGRAMEFCNSILSYVSICSGLDVDKLETLPWTEVIEAWNVCLRINAPNDLFPIYKVKSNVKDKTAVWDYDGRIWYIWAHNLASEYGWSLEYIAEMDVDYATALFEEIFVDEQLDREFHWMTSEIAYPYNPASKKGEFKPLPRPSWMMDEIRILQRNNGEPPKVKILKDHMPVGLIIRGKRNEDTIN